MKAVVPSGGRAGFAGLVGVLLVAAGTGGALAAPAPVTTTAQATAPGRYDFDVTAVGVPQRTIGSAKQAGVVDVYFPDGRTQRLSQSSLGLGLSSYQLFGAAVSVADLNGDGLSDLVIGAPGVASKGRTGHAYVLLQGTGGFTAARTTELDSTALAGDRFGAALSVTSRVSSNVVHDLWIGAPGRNINGVKDAGALYRYVVDGTGGANLNDVISQDTAELSQAAETGDQFGEVLAEKQNGVVVGVPHEDVGAGKDAGEVVYLFTDETNDLLLPAQTFSQNTAGVPGASATGDRMGASVSPYGFAVGIPGDDLGTIKDAGRVQMFIPANGTSGRYQVYASLTEDSTDMLGVAQAGDQYGAAVTLGQFRCSGNYQLAIGAPGEKVGKARNAGTVFVQNVPGLSSGTTCKSKVVRQGKGELLGGTAKTSDHLGATLGAMFGDPAELTTRVDNLAVGIAGKDTTKADNTGRVALWSGHGKGFVKNFGYSGGDAKSLGYGSSFGTLNIRVELAM
jgi:hypothetical protein